MSYIDTINKNDEVGICEHCGEPVMIGSNAVHVEGYLFHESCLKEMTGLEIMDWFGFEVKEMSEIDND